MTEMEQPTTKEPVALSAPESIAPPSTGDALAKPHQTDEPKVIEDAVKPAALEAPPDGGVQAWLAVLGGFCTVFASFGWINCT